VVITASAFQLYLLIKSFYAHCCALAKPRPFRTFTIKVEAVIEVVEPDHPVAVSNRLLGDIEQALIISDTSLDELINDIQDVAAYIDQTPLQRHIGLINPDSPTSSNPPPDIIPFP